MKKADLKYIFYISLALSVLVLTVVLLCIFSVAATNFCTAYVVIARCNDSIVIVNVRDLNDRHMRTVDPSSPLKNGDVVNYFLLIISSYDSTTVVKVLSDDYDAL